MLREQYAPPCQVLIVYHTFAEFAYQSPQTSLGLRTLRAALTFAVTWQTVSERVMFPAASAVIVQLCMCLVATVHTAEIDY